VKELKLPKGVLDEKELEEILEEETGLEEAAAGQIDKKPLEDAESGHDSPMEKTIQIEKDIMEIKAETSFLREKLNEQSDVLLELIKLVKEMKE
jgi:hypothetical protein